MAVVTTLLIVVAIATILVSHVYLLGVAAGSELTAGWRKTHARLNVFCEKTAFSPPRAPSAACCGSHMLVYNDHVLVGICSRDGRPVDRHRKAVHGYHVLRRELLQLQPPDGR